MMKLKLTPVDDVLDGYYPHCTLCGLVVDQMYNDRPYVCGLESEHSNIVACEVCLQRSGSEIDEEIESRAEECDTSAEYARRAGDLEDYESYVEHARWLRSLKGKLELPTFDEWKSANELPAEYQT
jgi:hypothetical protein